MKLVTIKLKNKRHGSQVESTTCPGPSLAKMISGWQGAIGFFEKSCKVSWLVWNEVYVFGFEVEFAAEVSNENSLPLGSHFSSSDFTEFNKDMDNIVNYNNIVTTGS